jgi:hypothetical protein
MLTLLSSLADNSSTETGRREQLASTAEQVTLRSFTSFYVYLTCFKVQLGSKFHGWLVETDQPCQPSGALHVQPCSCKNLLVIL